MNTDATADSNEVLDQEALFQAATNAAEAGNAAEMLGALYQTGILDGIARHLVAQWTDFDFDDATSFVAEATDNLFSQVRAGRRIRTVPAYLFKVAQNKAIDEYGRRAKHVSLGDPENDLQDPRSLPEPASLPREALTRKALQLARQFLKELGQENMQKVMAIYFDAIEKGIGDVSTAEIAEMLDLSEETVRQCRSRGWRRLRRVAEAHGVNLEQALSDLQTEEYQYDDE